jgi:hypothetical protein
MAAVTFGLIEECDSRLVIAHPYSSKTCDISRIIITVCVAPCDVHEPIAIGYFGRLFSPLSFDALLRSLFYTFTTAKLIGLLHSDTWRVLAYAWRKDLLSESNSNYIRFKRSKYFKRS